MSEQDEEFFDKEDVLRRSQDYSFSESRTDMDLLYERLSGAIDIGTKLVVLGVIIGVGYLLIS